MEAALVADGFYPLSILDRYRDIRYYLHSLRGGADDATDLSVLCHANNGAWHPAKPSLSAGHPSHPSFAYSVRPSGWSIVLTAGNQWASSENK